jgi:hypothetical protein
LALRVYYLKHFEQLLEIGMKQLIAMLMALGMLTACAGSSEPEMAAEQAKPVETVQEAKPAVTQEKAKCAVDTDCKGDYGMCIKPEAADYGFCL